MEGAMKELLTEKFERKFESQIIYRGKDYFRTRKVKKCIKTPDGYIAKVHGNDDYNVEIKVNN